MKNNMRVSNAVTGLRIGINSGLLSKVTEPQFS